jgi:hypothetical protein
MSALSKTTASPAPPATDTMLPTKDELLNYYYLGIPEIREQAVWGTIGQENKLVTADSALAADREAVRIAEIEEVQELARPGPNQVNSTQCCVFLIRVLFLPMIKPASTALLILPVATGFWEVSPIQVFPVLMNMVCPSVNFY